MAIRIQGAASSAANYSGIVRQLLFPTWAVIGILLLLPVLLMVVYSFLTKEFRGGVEWTFTLAAYDQFFLTRGLFGDEPPKIEWTYIEIFWRSIWQAALATLACLLIGFPTAWFIATRPARSRTMWLFLITIPYWVNLLIRTVSLRFILRDNGPLNEALLAIGIISEPLPILNSNLAVQIGLFYSYLPFMVLPIYAAVERFDFALAEAAADLYANRWQALMQIVLPVVRPGIVAGSILVFIPALGAFLAPDLLGGAVAVVLMTLVLIVLLVQARAATRQSA